MPLSSNFISGYNDSNLSNFKQNLMRIRHIIVGCMILWLVVPHQRAAILLLLLLVAIVHHCRSIKAVNCMLYFLNYESCMRKRRIRTHLVAAATSLFKPANELAFVFNCCSSYHSCHRHCQSIAIAIVDRLKL